MSNIKKIPNTFMKTFGRLGVMGGIIGGGHVWQMHERTNERIKGNERSACACCALPKKTN